GHLGREELGRPDCGLPLPGACPAFVLLRDAPHVRVSVRLRVCPLPHGGCRLAGHRRRGSGHVRRCRARRSLRHPCRARLVRMKEILETLESWDAVGLRAAWAILVETQRSTPREPG